MTRSRLWMLAAFVCCALAPLAAGSTAAADPPVAVPSYGYEPCDPVRYNGGWSSATNTFFFSAAECGGDVSLRVNYQGYGPEPATSTKLLRPGKVRRLDLHVAGRDRSGDGVVSTLAVCAGPNYPDDCGTPVVGSSDPPYAPRLVTLTRENGGIPENADRLMMYSACPEASFANPCNNSVDDTRFFELYIAQEDFLPPLMGEFGPAPESWVNAEALENIAIPISDDASGVAKVSLRADQLTSSWVCSSLNGCPFDTTHYANFRNAGLFTGRNTVTVTAFDAAGNTSERRLSFRYDNRAPSPPSELRLASGGSWVVGDKATVRWTNYPENLETSSGSGVASVRADLTDADGRRAPGFPKTVSGQGIDSLPIELPSHSRWSLQLTLTDAAGNQSDPATFVFESEPTGPGSPWIGQLAPIGLAQAAAGRTITWNAALASRSGICSYRAWIGLGDPPNLATSSSFQVSSGNTPSWTISPSGLRNLHDGVNTLAVAAVDCAGEVGPQRSAPIVIDRASPSAQLAPQAGWLSAGSTPTVSAEDAGTAAEKSGVKSVWYRIDSAPRITVAGDAADLPPLPPGEHQIAFGSIDNAGNESLVGSRTIGFDPDAPDVSIERVSADPAELVARIWDRVSGVTRVSAELVSSNGDRISFGDRLSFLEPRRGQVALPLSVPSALPDGVYLLEVAAEDAAGNRSTAAARQLVLPLRPTPRLTAELAAKSKPAAVSREATFAFGARAALTGRLTGRAGEPIVGAALTVTAERAASGGRRVLAVVTTGTDGRYKLELPPDVSRVLRVQFAGAEAWGPVAATATQNVRASVSMRAAKRRVLRGRPMIFSGRVGLLSASVPARGLLVHFEQCTRKRCKSFGFWRRTDSEGGYRFALSTKSLDRGTYRLRAKVEGVSGWPFADGWSRVVKVVVR